MKKNVFILSLALNVVLVFSCIFLFVKFDGYKIIKLKMQSANASSFGSSYDARLNLFESLPTKSADIVFLGDSITAGGEWSEFFQGNNVINRGVSKDTTSGLLKRLPSIVKLKPNKIFIMIGINDLGKGSENDVIENYKKIIRYIKVNSPNTNIYIQSILPTDNERSIDKISNVNAELKDLAIKNSLVYIDLYHLYLKNGRINQDLTYDGTHLNGSGYSIWKNAIENYVNN